MTIQEYIKIAVLGFPKEEFLNYRRFFIDMDCYWCNYNGFPCKSPRTEGVCINYEIKLEDVYEKLKHKKLKHEQKVSGEVV